VSPQGEAFATAYLNDKSEIICQAARWWPVTGPLKCATHKLSQHSAGKFLLIFPLQRGMMSMPNKNNIISKRNSLFL